MDTQINAMNTGRVAPPPQRRHGEGQSGSYAIRQNERKKGGPMYSNHQNEYRKGGLTLAPGSPGESLKS